MLFSNSTNVGRPIYGVDVKIVDDDGLGAGWKSFWRAKVRDLDLFRLLRGSQL